VGEIPIAYVVNKYGSPINTDVSTFYVMACWYQGRQRQS